MANKPKTNYRPGDGEEVSEKDLFQTPRWATKLLLPFVPEGILRIWECACGEGQMSSVLREFGFEVVESDVRDLGFSHRADFLKGDPPEPFDAIVTNAPFSLKYRFASRCLDLGRPWAILMPFDWSGEMARLKRAGCRFLLPDCRVNYLTPNILRRVFEGETLKRANARRKGGSVAWGVAKDFLDLRPAEVEDCGCHAYERLEDVPARLLASYTQAQMHSAWVTWGFDLPEVLTDVPVSDAMRREIV